MTNRLVQHVWVNTPARAARRGGGWLMLTSDGHWLTALGISSALLPTISLLTGLAVGWRHLSFDVAATESTFAVIAMLVLGILSGRLALMFFIGFVLGDFFLAHTDWLLHNEFGSDFRLSSVPFLANLWYERVPLLSHYTLLGTLMAGIPLAARGLAASVVQHTRGPALLRLIIAATLTAIAMGVLIKFWTNAAPHVVRPLFTWNPLMGGAAPPIAAIAPTQQNNTIMIAGVLATVIRFAVVTFIDKWRAGRERVSDVEHRIGAAVLDIGPLPRPSAGRLVISALIATILSLLFLAGLLDKWTTAGVIGGAFFLLRLAKLGVVPFPSNRWRFVVNKVPVALRFGIALLIINGIAQATAGAGFQTAKSLEYLVWPMIAGFVVLTTLFPNPARGRSM